MAKISHTKVKQPSFGEKRPKLTYTKISRFTVIDNWLVGNELKLLLINDIWLVYLRSRVMWNGKLHGIFFIIMSCNGGVPSTIQYFFSRNTFQFRISDSHNITKILFKVMLNTITLTPIFCVYVTLLCIPLFISERTVKMDSCVFRIWPCQDLVLPTSLEN